MLLYRGPSGHRRRPIGGIAPRSRMFPRRDGRLLVSCSSCCPCSMLVSARRALLARLASLGRGPRHRRLLRRCHTASTRRSLHCRSRRTIAPPRTYGAWNAAAVTLAGHGGGGLRALRARLLLPPATTGFALPFFPARPPFQGQGFPPQVVSRRGLPRRGTPLVPLPCLIYCHGFHVLCPRVGLATLRVVG